MKLSFDVRHLYYLPQYLPVYHEYTRRGCGEAMFVFYHSQHDEIIEAIIAKENLPYIWVDSPDEATEFYLKDKADWVFFANAFAYLDELHKVSSSAQLGHGIGPKASYYTKSDTPTTVRFVEGAYRTTRFNELYPNDTFIDVGFCKLDPIINQVSDAICLEEVGLDPNKPTLLYAPTFYPSSIECFAKDWPQEFSEYNILIKPHYFLLSKVKYAKQRKLLEYWSSFNNVYLASVEDYSLIPFMASSDVLISEASSALFEFAALNKPVVWCDFFKLRWSYRGIFSYRFKKRMDQDYGNYKEIAVHAKNYKSLKSIVDKQVQTPSDLEEIRLSYAEKLAGKVDGKSSERIVNYLVQSLSLHKPEVKS